jgi:hypothetical protein
MHYSDRHFFSHSVQRKDAYQVLLKGREVYEKYYWYFIRCAEMFDPLHKATLHFKMIDWLRVTNCDETTQEGS